MASSNEPATLSRHPEALTRSHCGAPRGNRVLRRLRPICARQFAWNVVRFFDHNVAPDPVDLGPNTAPATRRFAVRTPAIARPNNCQFSLQHCSGYCAAGWIQTAFGCGMHFAYAVVDLRLTSPARVYKCIEFSFPPSFVHARWKRALLRLLPR